MQDAHNTALSIAVELTAPASARRRLTPRSVDEIYHLAPSEEARLAQARFCHAMYQGDQLAYIPKLPGESPLEFSRRPHKCFLNLTRVIIDVLGQLYHRPVNRRYSGDARAAERIQRAFSINPMAPLMLTVDRLTRLQGVCALSVSYQEGELRFWPWPAHRLVVLPDPALPVRPLAVVALAFGEREENLAHVWTARQVTTVVNGRVAAESSHELGRVPFVFFHDRLPVDGFWVEGRGRSLCHANAEFNAKLSELAFTVAMQGFGVMEIVNPDPAQEIAVGPARAIAFSVSGQQPFGINFKSPNAPIAELIADLEFHLRTLLKTQRVPESVLSVNVGQGVSGVSILAAQSPVLEDRVERMALFGAAEQDLLRCALAVLREHEGLTGEVSLGVDFPEPQLEQSISERMAHDSWRLEHGLLAPWDIMLRDDPDAFDSPEEAKRLWLARRAELTAIGPGGAGQAALLARDTAR